MGGGGCRNLGWGSVKAKEKGWAASSGLQAKDVKSNLTRGLGVGDKVKHQGGRAHQPKKRFSGFPPKNGQAKSGQATAG